MKKTPEQRTAENNRDAARSKPTLQDLKDRVAAFEKQCKRNAANNEHVYHCATYILKAIEALVVNLKP